jgi:hypothetical protein
MSFDDLCREHASKWKVSAAVHEQDFIFHFILNHPRFFTPDAAVKEYFDIGRKSAELLMTIVRDDLSIDVAAEKKLLEFASGYGAVTRHLHSVFPALDVTSSDIHQDANDFIATEMEVRTIPSSSVPESFDPAGEYDLAFALSFFSHMPRSTWFRWINALFKALRVGGSLIFTTHGAISLRLLSENTVLDDDGFSFTPESEQDDLEKSEYGTTFTSSRFVIAQLEKLENCELRLVRAGFWYGHQDLYVASKLANATKTPVADCRVYQKDEGPEGYVDNVFVVRKKNSAEERCILRVTGWAAPYVKGDKCADDILILFQAEDGSVFSCEAARRHRPDVARAFGNPALLETGFAAEVDITDLGGKMTMLLATRSGDELKLCPHILIPLDQISNRPR